MLLGVRHLHLDLIVVSGDIGDGGSVEGAPGLDAAVLQKPEALAAAMVEGDVRAVLCGHLHVHLSGSLAGTPVWVTPGVVTRIDLTAEPGLVRGVRGLGIGRRPARRE